MNSSITASDSLRFFSVLLSSSEWIHESSPQRAKMAAEVLKYHIFTQWDSQSVFSKGKWAREGSSKENFLLVYPSLKKKKIPSFGSTQAPFTDFCYNAFTLSELALIMPCHKKKEQLVERQLTAPTMLSSCHCPALLPNKPFHWIFLLASML